MSRPKNIDSILIALKAKTMEFERENGLHSGNTNDSVPKISVLSFVEDLKAIFIGNTKLVAPFYLDAIRQLEQDMSFVKPAQFNRLVMDAKMRNGTDLPPDVSRVRQLADEKRQGIFRCLMCNEIVDVESPSILWDSKNGGYRHAIDCEMRAPDATTDNNTTAA